MGTTDYVMVGPTRNANVDLLTFSSSTIQLVIDPTSAVTLSENSNIIDLNFNMVDLGSPCSVTLV